MSILDFLDIIPIILAVIAIVLASNKLFELRRKQEAITCILSILGAILLIVAQSSWWVSAVIENDLIGTWFSNRIWLIFNTIMMSNIIINSLPRSTK